MGWFLARRLLASAPLLLLSSALVFLLVAATGDPLGGLPPDTDARIVEDLRADLHLDDPIIERYGHWLGGALRGDFGQSIDRRPVDSLLWQRAQVTLRMVTAGLVLSVLASLAVGSLAASRPRAAVDRLVTTLSFVALSLPVFWLGAVLKEFVALPVNDFLGRRVLFTVGEASPNVEGGLLARVGDYAGHLVLPTLALGAVLVAAWSRYVRASMIDALGRDHIGAARARGVPERRLVLRHALPNAAGPFTNLVAVDFAQVLGGAVVLERVFGWNGLGDLLVTGVLASDTNVVLAWLMLTAVAVVVCNALAEVAAARLDPRIGVG